MEQYNNLMRDMGISQTPSGKVNKRRGDKVALGDLVDSGEAKGEAKVKQALSQLNKTVGLKQVSYAVTAQQDRKAGLKVVKEEVEKWGPVIRKQRQMKTADYREKTIQGKRLEGDYVESLGGFGGAVEKKLKELKMDSEGNVLAKEREALNKVEPQESERRVHLLRKQREIMFQEELKHKRLKKIKSKVYRKIRNKQKTGDEEAEGEEGQMERLQEERATERVSLKHRTHGKYIKQLMRYAGDKDRGQAAVQDVKEIRNQIVKKYQPKEEGQAHEDFDDQHFREEAIRQIERDFLEDKEPAQEEGKQKSFMEKLNRKKKDQRLEEAAELVTRLKDEEDRLSSEGGEDREEEESQEGEADSEEEDIRNALEQHKEQKSQKKAKGFEGRKTYGKAQLLDEEEDLPVPGDDITKGIDVGALKRKYQKENVGELKEEHLKDFNGDNIVPANDLEEDFLDQKRDLLELEVPEEEAGLKGWGNWTGQGVKEKEVDQEALKRKRAELMRKVARGRKDGKLGQVVLNEERSAGVTQYLVKKLPYQFKNKQQFNYLNNQSVGGEWNSASQHASLVQPKVRTTKGQVIQQVLWDQE